MLGSEEGLASVENTKVDVVELGAIGRGISALGSLDVAPLKVHQEAWTKWQKVDSDCTSTQCGFNEAPIRVDLCQWPRKGKRGEKGRGKLAMTTDVALNMNNW